MSSSKAGILLIGMICVGAQPAAASQVQTNVPVQPGDHVTLACKAPNSDPVTVLEWRRPDLGIEYVGLFRDDQFDPGYQHPSYLNRVDLQDRQMTDGDVSLVLKNVTTDDEGTYECRIFQRRRNRLKRSILKSEPICVVSLVVVPPAPPDGYREDGVKEDGVKKDSVQKEAVKKDGLFGLILGVSILGLVVVVAICLKCLKCKGRLSPDPNGPPAAAAEQQQVKKASDLDL